VTPLNLGPQMQTAGFVSARSVDATVAGAKTFVPEPAAFAPEKLEVYLLQF